MNAKIIFHIDLNAFFATCAQIKDPFLKGKAFGVGNIYADGSRGILTTASYEARKYGIGAAMSIKEAKMRYPKFIVVPIDFDSYHYYSNIFFNYLKRYSNIILKGSIDEAYVDMTDYLKNKNALKIAKKIQTELLELYELPVSIGIAPTVFLAKMASDMKKPLGITVLRIKDIKKILFPLTIKKLFGIGKKTYPKLESLGIKTIGDFALESNEDKILTIMSKQNYLQTLSSILGASTNIIDPSKYEIPKSISNEETLGYNIFDDQSVILLLTDLLKKVVDRLNYDNLVAKTIFIKYRYEDGTLKTKSYTLDDYQSDYHIFYDTMMIVYELNPLVRPVRLIGVGLSNIIRKSEFDNNYHLFNYQEFNKKNDEIINVYQNLPETLKSKVKLGKKIKK